MYSNGNSFMFTCVDGNIMSASGNSGWNCSITSNHEEFREIIDECTQFGGDYNKSISCSNGSLEWIMNFIKIKIVLEKENHTFAPEDGWCSWNNLMPGVMTIQQQLMAGQLNQRLE